MKKVQKWKWNCHQGIVVAMKYQKHFFMLSYLLMLHLSVFAQSGTIDGLTQLQNTVVQGINIFFVIVIFGALIRVIMLVVKDSPNWGSSVVGLVVGIVLWAGFNTYKEDIFGWFGGGQIIDPSN